MSSKGLLEEILRLPVADRLELLEQIWDSIAATPEELPVPEWHKAELDRRLDHPSPDPPLSWDEVRARLNQDQ
jgi:putative addiction module component (TIGR02574 family)